MVGTVSAARGRRGRAAAGAAFGAGLALGATILFGSLGALGAGLDPGGMFLAAAGVIAAAAALADLAGARVRPQVHLQVPERWRRTMSLPQALFLYGVLLGTGVTTLVPAAAAWALLPLCVALGSIQGAITVGLSFAAGRALPVLVLASRWDEGLLAERPRGLRVLRALAAASLALALVAGEARAASRVASPAGDPSAAGADLVWQRPGVGGFLLRGGQLTQLPGTDPTIGGPYIAWRVRDLVTVAASETLQPVLQLTIPDVEKLAVSEGWLAYRVRYPSGSVQIRALPLGNPTSTRAISQTHPRGALGRPSLYEGTVVYHLATAAGSKLLSFDLVSGKQRVLRSSTRAQLLNPTQIGGRLLYVRLTRCAQQLRLGSIGGNRAGRVLYSLPPLAGQDTGHERGHTRQGEHLPCSSRPRPTRRMLWTTAVTPTAAYVTVLTPAAGGTLTPSLLAITR
jgi:hypothetical protein